MRVIAGTARSLPLKAPKGTEIRPTTDRIKETLFNMLMPYLPGSVFIDVFSGSGSIGIEALSRGASKAYFIDDAKQAISCIQENLAFTKFKDRAIVIKQDASVGLMGIRSSVGLPSEEKHSYVDVIFMDPPYGQGMEKKVLEVLSGLKYVGPDTLIIVEASIDTDFTYLSGLGFSLTRLKKYRTSQHVFIQKQ